MDDGKLTEDTEISAEKGFMRRINKTLYSIAVASIIIATVSSAWSMGYHLGLWR